MRIVSGKQKGGILLAPEDKRVRPTTDRVKETMFNILSCKVNIEDSEVLDLFSGSGALGIEALSRGARNVVFADADQRSIALTKENLKKFGLSAEVYIADYKLALKRLAGRKFDIIFLDPPYFKNFEQEIFALILKYDILKQNGIILLEHTSEISLQYELTQLIIDTRKLGNTSLSFVSYGV